MRFENFEKKQVFRALVLQVLLLRHKLDTADRLLGCYKARKYSRLEQKLQARRKSVCNSENS